MARRGACRGDRGVIHPRRMDRRANIGALRFALRGAVLEAMPSGALLWPDEGMLVVSDLHLGKSERMARRGGAFLPPYETRETLRRLAADVHGTGAGTVLCLGDSFDDLEAAGNLAGPEVMALGALMAGRRWIWVEGNHDPGPLPFGGERAAEVAAGPLLFRHVAAAGRPGAAGEVSGHWHPKIAVAGVSRACFVIDGARAILPAYGAYTGGLHVGHPEIDGRMGPGAVAVLTAPEGGRAVAVPLRGAASRRRRAG